MIVKCKIHNSTVYPYIRINGRIPPLPVRCPRGRQAEWPSCRTDEELHPALPGPQPDGKGSQKRQPQAPTEREPQVRHENLAPPAGLHWRGIRHRKRSPDQEAGRRCLLPARQSIKESALCPRTRHGRAFGGRRVIPSERMNNIWVKKDTTSPTEAT